MSYTNDFMVLIKKLRTLNKMSQEDMSKIIGVSYQAYAHYEKGRRSPDFETVVKLALYFNVSIDYLLGAEKQKAIPQDLQQLITYYDQCDEIDKAYLLERAKLMANNNREVYKDVDKTVKPLKKAE